MGDLLHTARPVPAPCPELEASHVKELAFQKAKLYKRTAQALKHGLVSVAELSDELAQGALQHFGPDGDDAPAPKRQRRPAAAKAASAKPGYADVQGKGAFLADDVPTAQQPALVAMIKRGGMWLCHDIARAGVIVTEDITRLGQCQTISAALGGVLVVTPLWITSGGQHGPSLQYDAAVSKRRSVWCSADFIDMHPDVHAIMVGRSQMRGAAWTWLRDKTAVLAMAEKKTASKTLMIFVTPGEQTSQDTWSCKLAVHKCRAM